MVSVWLDSRGEARVPSKSEIEKMAAIYIEYYVGVGAVKNIADGEDVYCELEKAKLCRKDFMERFGE